MKRSLLSLSTLAATALALNAAPFNFDTLAGQPANTNFPSNGPPGQNQAGPVLGPNITTNGFGSPVTYSAQRFSGGSAVTPNSVFTRDYVQSVSGSPMFAPTGGFDSLNVTGFVGSTVTVRISAPGAVGPQLVLGSLLTIDTTKSPPQGSLGNRGQGVARVRAYTGSPGTGTLINNANWTITGPTSNTGFDFVSDAQGAGATNGANNPLTRSVSGGIATIRNDSNINTNFNVLNNSRMIAFTAPGLQYDYLELDLDYSGITGPVATDEIQIAFGLEVIPEPSTALLGVASLGLLLRRRR